MLPKLLAYLVISCYRSGVHIKLLLLALKLNILPTSNFLHPTKFWAGYVTVCELLVADLPPVGKYYSDGDQMKTFRGSSFWSVHLLEAAHSDRFIFSRFHILICFIFSWLLILICFIQGNFLILQQTCPSSSSRITFHRLNTASNCLAA